jgi:lysyl-tRNA synthetase class 2
VPRTIRHPETGAGADPRRASALWQVYLQRAPGLIAGLARLAGLLAIIDAALPAEERHRAHAITHVLPVPPTDAATAVMAALGLLLLRVAAGLRRRKRRAWRVAVAATVLIGLGSTLKAHKAEEGAAGVLIVTVVLLAMLLGARSRFSAKADPASRWLALRLFLQFTAAGLTYGMAMLYLYPRHVVGHPSFGNHVIQVLCSMVGATGPLQLQGERFRDIFNGTLLSIGLLTLALVLTLLLRPSEPLARLSPTDDQRLRELLRAHGHRDSLGYFALRRDKSVVWSPTGKAAIAYRVVHGVLLASGDPIGDPEAWPGAIDAYRALAEQYGWVPAVIGCSELGATVFKREYGLPAIMLGDEAVIEVSDFTLQGRPMRGVRQACTRVARAGHNVQVRRAKDIDPAELSDVVKLAATWRGDEVERGFSMALSRIGEPGDGDCVIVTAEQDGLLRGVLHLVPWGADRLSLDLMRRDHAADNGLNEYLIVNLIEAAPALGFTRVSLNFAVFREAIERGERIGAGPVLRGWRKLLIFASRWWQIETLYRFNAKFRPDWEPRFLSYQSNSDLPRIVVAALDAEAFIARPRLLKRFLRRA